MSASCLYVGRVRHRRHRPLAHAFEYRLFMVYLDLAELPGLFDGRWLWSARRPAPAWFRRADHLGDPARPLDEAVRDLVEARTGRRPAGPVRLLTHLRYFGHCFNPVSFYFCFDARDREPEAIVAEVSNTPWGERHCYVLPVRDPAGPAHEFRMPKRFHVSPFLPMDMSYRWRVTTPARRLAVHMENHRDGRRWFDASLSLERRPLTSATLAGALLRYPLMTLRVVAAIYWQALRLRLKGADFHPHPERGAPGRAGETRS